VRDRRPASLAVSVAPRPVLFQAAHHNPVEIAADEVEEPGRLGAAVMGGGGERLAPKRAQACRRLGRLTSRMRRRISSRPACSSSLVSNGVRP